MRAENANVSRLWLAVKIFILATLLIWFNFFPRWVGVFSIHSSRGLSVVTPSDLGLALPYELFSFWLLLAIANNFVLMVQGRWTRETRWVELALSTFTALILVVILLDNIGVFRLGIAIPGVSNRGVRVLVGRAIQLGFAIALLSILVTIVKRLRSLFEALPSTPKELTKTEVKPVKAAGDGWDDFERTIRRDLKDVYNFYLDDEARTKLSGMGLLKKSFFFTIWLAKSMFLKLTPARRILLIIALLLPRMNIDLGNASIGTGGAGYVLLLLILLLELKDKILARDELAVGRAVQVALLPEQSPRVAGWDIWLLTRPANEVGGDLVDYLKIGENRWGLSLGDVAGKGLGAALLMAKLQATIRALSPSFESLSDFGAEVNAIIYRDGLRNRFASLLYLELRADSSLVRLVNAGHLPPVVLHNGETRELPMGAPALGLMPGTSYTEERLDLGLGDFLFVFSDGLTEAMNEEGNFYGNERLLKLLPGLSGFSAAAAGERLLAEIETFVGDAPASDDLSLLLLKRMS